MDEQLSLFPDALSAPAIAPPPLPDFTALAPSITDELAAAWSLPIGRHLHVELRGHEVAGLRGLLQVVSMPEYPFDPRRALHLRIGHVSFTSQQIASWSII